MRTPNTSLTSVCRAGPFGGAAGIDFETREA
jgi:hypothetical protein